MPVKLLVFAGTLELNISYTLESVGQATRDETQGFHWAVESQTKKGWNRFVDHHYIPQTQPVIFP
jgi:hypothetical protein